MKFNFWKLALLLSLLCSGLSFTACDDNDDNIPNPPAPGQDTVEFAGSALLMSLNESQLLSTLIKECDVPSSKINFEVEDEQVARIENARVISTGAGETTIKATYNGKTSQASLMVQDFTQPYDITPEIWSKYIWDYKTSSAKILNLTGRPVVVDFWADWCGPCQMLSPVINRLCKSYDGKALFLKVDLSSETAPGFEIVQALFDAEHPALDNLLKNGAVELPSIVMIPIADREPSMQQGPNNAANVIGDFLTAEFNARSRSDAPAL